MHSDRDLALSADTLRGMTESKGGKRSQPLVSRLRGSIAVRLAMGRACCPRRLTASFARSAHSLGRARSISQVVTSAPGKVIFSGEHVVLPEFGHPALAAAIQLRVRVFVHASDDGKIRFQSGKDSWSWSMAEVTRAGAWQCRSAVA